MAAVTIRNLDDRIRERLRVRAAMNGRSMEAEIRVILADAVADSPEGSDLFSTLLDRFGQVGGVDLELPRRATPARAAD
ncbi:MAG: Arc family DNA-binding protein, partial [Micromonosporaceae bacterium]|nr:Arc family DNA-binding protein [Micromonosporaceae bacterium]